MSSSAYARLFNRSAVPSLSRLVGVRVTLTGGTTTSNTFRARRGDTLASSIGELGIGGRATVQTWILPRTDCVLGTATVKPQAGFTITEIDDTGATANTWEIHSPDPDTPAVEPDHNDNDWICHTRRVNG